MRLFLLMVGLTTALALGDQLFPTLATDPRGQSPTKLCAANWSKTHPTEPCYVVYAIYDEKTIELVTVQKELVPVIKPLQHYSLKMKAPRFGMGQNMQMTFMGLKDDFNTIWARDYKSKIAPRQ